MEEQKIINLSFDEKKVSKKRIGNRTIVALTSYMKEEKLRMYFNYIGFRSIPDIVLEILENGGYKYDYKLHGWKTNTSGVIVLNQDDEDNQDNAWRIAMTKAKLNAYKKAYRCLSEIESLFLSTTNLIQDSVDELVYLINEETNAFERVKETGYCDVNKQ